MGIVSTRIENVESLEVVIEVRVILEQQDEYKTLKVLAILTAGDGPTDSYDEWSPDGSSSWQEGSAIPDRDGTYFNVNLTIDARSNVYYLVARSSITKSDNIWRDWTVSPTIAITNSPST